MTPAVSFRARLRRALQIGVIGDTIDPVVVESMAALGFDFYTADLEHGLASDEACGDFIRTCALAGMHPIVRVPPAERARITRLLDAGAEGILAPGIEDHRQVVELGQTVRFPPAGRRGMSATYVSRHGFLSTDREFLMTQQARVAIIVQIENASALADISKMAAAGVADAMIVGERDLSISLGIPGETSHPRIREAQAQLRRAGRDSDVAVGALARTADDAAALADEKDLRIVFVPLSSILRSGGEAFVSAIRSRRLEPIDQRMRQRT